jgi:isopentenyldiphosphate isomerase
VADDELLDVVDDWGRPVGVADRRTVHAEGLWHRVAHILLIADREGVPTVVLQERALHKATFPGLLDLSATGHLSAGEAPAEGVRELREELGVEVAIDALVPLGVRRIVDEIPGGVNRELVHLFLARDDRPLEEYDPAPAEVSAVVDLPVAAGIDLVARRRATVDCRVCPTGSQVADVRSVAVGDLVPEPPMVGDGGQGWGYWTVALVMAQRYAAGERGLAI